MTRLEAADKIEGIVGATRHQSDHIGRAVSAEQRVYILHSADCVATGQDLRACEFSVALDEYGIETGPNTPWQEHEDEVVVLRIDEHVGELLPDAVACVTCGSKNVTLYTGHTRYCDDHGPDDDDPQRSPQPSEAFQRHFHALQEYGYPDGSR